MRQDGIMQPRDFSLYGAVDLGARQVAAQRRQQTAQSGESAAPSSGAVIEVTEQTFNTDVVERSRTTPVIIDLWAEWCGPCQQLSPVLEKLAAEADGQWVLAKVDVDANPQLSAALQVQSIPMVVAVIGGQLVDGFLGAMPEAQVRQWIGQVLAVAEQMGLQIADGSAGEPEGDAPGEGAQDSPRGPQVARDGLPGAADAGPARPSGGYGDTGQLPPAYAEARAAMERGDLDAAAEAFEEELAVSPGDPVAKTGLAQVNLLRRVSSYDQARSRSEAAEHPADVAPQIRVADIDLASGRIDEAFDRLLGVVRRTSGEDRDQARAHLVGLFDILPPKDPRVTRARSTLSALLF
jgi:putative thioredoxin